MTYPKPYTFTEEPGLGWAVEYAEDEILAQDVALYEALMHVLCHHAKITEVQLFEKDLVVCESATVIRRFLAQMNAGKVHFIGDEILAIARGS